MSHSPCHHDCSDFTDDPADDLGCCGPIPVRKDCGAPTLPTPECDGDEATLEFDPETQEFIAVGILFDHNCEPILDQDEEQITTAIS